jgi:hypothetical protein
MEQCSKENITTLVFFIIFYYIANKLLFRHLFNIEITRKLISTLEKKKFLHLYCKYFNDIIKYIAK